MNATDTDYVPNIIFTTYSKAQSELAKGKPKGERKKVANNTYLIQRDGYIAVRLHNTDVVDIYLDKLILRTGGWMTNTTKERINRYLPVGWNLYTEKRIWWLSYVTSYGEDGEQSKWQFKDGINIHQDGNVFDFERSPTKMPRRSKMVREFATEYLAKLSEGRMEAPSAGDCMYCFMHEVETGKLLGDLHQSDHMVLHLEEKYYVPSIIVNALTELGGSLMAKDYVMRKFNNEEEYSFGGIISEDLYRMLVRYVGRKVGLGG